jgi:CRISPR-associated protein Csm2
MNPPNKIPTTILTEGIKDLQPLKEWGDYFADDEKETVNGRERIKKTKVSTSQIRKFFGALKRIQADFDSSKGEILLLDAKLAYAVGRDVKNGRNQSKIKEFYDLVSPLIKNVGEDKAKFKHFVNVFEAIVAYHKAAGGQ